MDNVGYAALQIIPSFKGFESKLESGTRGSMTSAGTKGGTAYGDAAGKSAGSRFNRVFVGAAKVGLAGAVGAGIAAFKLGKDAIAQASDLNESLNAVNVTYDKQAAAVKKLGTQAAESLGLSNTEFNGLAVQFSAFATQVAGGEGPKVVGVLKELTTRGADFASVMNLEVNEAMGLFQSGLAGETEPLRKFGIDLSAAAVQAHAYKKGIADAGDELTEGEKVQARYSLLMEQTAKTQGDFKNTSDSLANSQRILSARWDNAQAKLGKALLPVMTDLVGLILDKGIPAVEKFGDWFAAEGIDHLEKFGGYAKDAAGFVKDLVGFINDIPNSAKLAGLAAVLGGSAALKLRGGAGGALGAAGSVLGLAKPVPVLVTNPGFGGPGGGSGGVAGGATKGGALKLAGATLLVGAGAEVLFGDSFGLRGQGQLDQQRNDPNGFGRLGAPRVLDGADFSSDFGGMVKSAVDSSAKITAAFTELPKTIQTRFSLLGVPESKAEAKNLVDTYNLTPKEKKTLFKVLGYDTSKAEAKALQTQYDLTPKEKKTAFQLLGYETLMSQIRNINTNLDLASRDRRTQITVAYASTGRNTVGGLQERTNEANGGIVEAFANGGFSASGKYVDRVPQLRQGGGAIMWNEPETGWEAYISGKPSMRERNIAVLAEVSRRLGIKNYADGGIASGRGATPTVNVGSPNVQVFIDGREVRATVRSEMASADRFDRRLRDRD